MNGAKSLHGYDSYTIEVVELPMAGVVYKTAYTACEKELDNEQIPKQKNRSRRNHLR